MDMTTLDLLKGGGLATVIIVAFWLLIVPIIRMAVGEVSASRKERQDVILPLIKAVTDLTLSVQISQQRNEEAHVALMGTIAGLKGAVDVLCQQASRRSAGG